MIPETKNSLTKRKNYLALGLMLAWILLVFAVTIIKVRENGAEAIKPIAEQNSIGAAE